MGGGVGGTRLGGAGPRDGALVGGVNTRGGNGTGRRTIANVGVDEDAFVGGGTNTSEFDNDEDGVVGGGGNSGNVVFPDGRGRWMVVAVANGLLMTGGLRSRRIGRG